MRYLIVIALEYNFIAMPMVVLISSQLWRQKQWHRPDYCFIFWGHIRYVITPVILHYRLQFMWRLGLHEWSQTNHWYVDLLLTAQFVFIIGIEIKYILNTAQQSTKHTIFIIDMCWNGEISRI